MGEKDDKTTDNKDIQDPDENKGPKTDDDTGAGDADVKDDKISSDDFSVAELCEDFGLDSPADLKEFVSNLNDMRGKIGDNDLDTLIENTKTLQKYQAEWQRQEEEKRREKETPEETIARLEKEKQQAITQNKTQTEKRKAQEAAKRAYHEFEETVDSVITNSKELPKAYRPMLRKFMGIDNPVTEVDITDKAALRRLTKNGVKEMNAFAQKIIKDYRDGKIKIPNVTPAEPAGGDSAQGKEPKNLKEAKAMMMRSASAYERRR
jgi:hypothetical protein